MNNFAASPNDYKFQEGDFFFGELNGQRLGVTSTRHAITVAGSRTGKGVGVINTNLRTWPHNVLVIDPKGEAASVSWKARKAKGQAVHVIDPFGRAKVPDDIQACYNPLDELDTESLTIAEDIEVIADGMVMRTTDPSSVTWDNGTTQLVSGVIAFVVANVEAKDRNLITMRRILIDTREGGLFDIVIDEMSKSTDEALGDLMRSGASRALAKEGDYYVSGAQANTKWLDSKGMKKVLTKSSFSMHDLKLKKASVFIALPFKYLPQQSHGRFLRLMVSCGINAMQEPTPEGEDMGEKCLFILDEFFSLGYIDQIATAIGGMASYGLHLWPFLQDLGQLEKLYGRDGAETFFGSSDLHQFFGVTDPQTLRFISEGIGNFTTRDLPPEPQPRQDRWNANMKAIQDLENNPPLFGNLSGSYMGAKMAAGKKLLWNHEEDHEIYRERLAQYNTDASRILGKPRMSPQEVAYFVRLEKKKPTAEAQISFVRGRQPLFCHIARYFEWVDETRAITAPVRTLAAHAARTKTTKVSNENPKPTPAQRAWDRMQEDNRKAIERGERSPEGAFYGKARVWWNKTTGWHKLAQ